MDKSKKDWAKNSELKYQKKIWNLVQQNYIFKNIAIRQFFNLQIKEVDNDLKVIINKITKAYSIGDKTYKTDEENIIISNVGYFKAIKIFQKLYLYEKQYENRNNK